MPLGIGMVKSWKLVGYCAAVAIAKDEQVVGCMSEGDQHVMKKILVNSCLVSRCYDLLQLKLPAIFSSFIPYP